MTIKRKPLALAGMCLAMLFGTFCTVGQVAYMEPTANDESQVKGEKLAEYCFSGAYAGSMDDALAKYKAETGKSTWSNVNLTYQPGFIDACYELNQLKEGANQ